jgi:hypothetical protein
MRWATLSHVHLDRVAAPWLVRRFVDTDATFEFVEWGLDGERPTPALLAHVPDGATPIGMPGASPLGLHDADGTCFSKVLRAYGLDDPALWRMERLIAAGVSHALGAPPPEGLTDDERLLGTALDLIGAALGVAFADTAHLEGAFPLYDAIFVHCQMLELPEDVRAAAPFLPPLRGPYLRAALASRQTS